MKHLVQGRSELCKPHRSVSYDQVDNIPAELALTRIGRQDGFDEFPSFERHFAIRRPDILDDLDIPTRRKRSISAVNQKKWMSGRARPTHKSHRPTCPEKASFLSTSCTYVADPKDLSAVQPRSLILPMRATHSMTPKLQISTSYECPPFCTKISGAI